jgi:putative transposase
VQELATEHRVSEVCELVEVSTSGYYSWLGRRPSWRERADEALAEQIKEVHRDSRRTYGSPRVTKALRSNGVRCGRKRVARIMMQEGLSGSQKARFRPRTTDSGHAYALSPNRLAEGVRIDGPNQAWGSDITYIATREGWMYLAAVMDLGTRTVKGWSLKDTLKTELVSEAFTQAVVRCKPAAGLIVHSDRGCQYASDEFRALLAQHKALGSMGRTGNCYDNATMESFFATLKTELNLRRPFKNKQEARLAIFDYIEIFYNRQRLHSSLGYRSPVEYERKLMAENTAPYVSDLPGQDQTPNAPPPALLGAPLVIGPRQASSPSLSRPARLSLLASRESDLASEDNAAGEIAAECKTFGDGT